MTQRQWARSSSAGEASSRADLNVSLGPFETLGQAFKVLTNSRELGELLAELYRPMQVTDGRLEAHERCVTYTVIVPGPDNRGVVLSDGKVVGRSDRRARIMQLLQWAVNHQVTMGAASSRLTLHAGGVQRNGRTVALVGVMESGKTTLTAGLASRGFTYMSDEAIAVGDDLEAQGYLKPLSVDPGSWEVLEHLRPPSAILELGYFAEQWQVPGETFAVETGPTPLGLILLNRYEPGADATLIPLPPAAALAALADCIFAAEGEPLPRLRLQQAARLVERLPIQQLVSSDLNRACNLVVEALDALDIGC